MRAGSVLVLVGDTEHMLILPANDIQMACDHLCVVEAVALGARHVTP